MVEVIANLFFVFIPLKLVPPGWTQGGKMLYDFLSLFSVAERFGDFIRYLSDSCHAPHYNKVSRQIANISVATQLVQIKDFSLVIP